MSSIDESVHRPPVWLRGSCFALGTVIPVIALLIAPLWMVGRDPYGEPWQEVLSLLGLLAIPAGIVTVCGVRACFHDSHRASSVVATVSGFFAIFPALAALLGTAAGAMHLEEFWGTVVVAYYLLTTCIVHARLASLLPARSSGNI